MVRGEEGSEGKGRGEQRRGDERRSSLVDELSNKVILCRTMGVLDLEAVEAQVGCNPLTLALIIVNFLLSIYILSV